jgi:uncharacterized protein (TIGR02145 family)
MKKVYFEHTIFIIITIITIVLINGCKDDDMKIPKELPPIKPCPGIAEVEYEDDIYPTVQIGNQCWMTKNLSIGKQLSHFQESTNNDTIEKYCYQNLSSNCEKNGGLYTWGEIMQYSDDNGPQGICPEGWHIPTVEEFEYLYQYVDGQTEYLLSTDSLTGNTGPVDCPGCIGKTGFNLRLIGSVDLDYFPDPFFGFRDMAHITSSSYGRFAQLQCHYFEIRTFANVDQFGFSVRCIKDE